MLPRKLIVGIGHSGSAFQKIRHNIGKHLLSQAAKQVSLQWTQCFQAAGSYIRLQNLRDGILRAQTILYVPTGLINSSGYNVKRALEFFEFNPFNPLENMVVLHDEMELKLGKYMFVNSERSLKGHNGLKSIQNSVGKGSFSRLKVGIGRPESKNPNLVGEYVMGEFKPEELKIIENSVGSIIYKLINENHLSVWKQKKLSLLK